MPPSLINASLKGAFLPIPARVSEKGERRYCCCWQCRRGCCCNAVVVVVAMPSWVLWQCRCGNAVVVVATGYAGVITVVVVATAVNVFALVVVATSRSNLFDVPSYCCWQCGYCSYCFNGNTGVMAVIIVAFGYVVGFLLLLLSMMS